MGEDFLKEYGKVAKQVKADPASVDLRAFIQNELDEMCIRDRTRN